jgi:uncharacterized protein YodC (DUF2158 family)
MKKYKTEDFEISEMVCHVTSRSPRMFINNTMSLSNQITCKWIYKNDVRREEIFICEELVKIKDLPPRIKGKYYSV